MPHLHRSPVPWEPVGTGENRTSRPDGCRSPASRGWRLFAGVSPARLRAGRCLQPISIASLSAARCPLIAAAGARTSAHLPPAPCGTKGALKRPSSRFPGRWLGAPGGLPLACRSFRIRQDRPPSRVGAGHAGSSATSSAVVTVSRTVLMSTPMGMTRDGALGFVGAYRATAVPLSLRIGLGSPGVRHSGLSAVVLEGVPDARPQDGKRSAPVPRPVGPSHLAPPKRWHERHARSMPLFRGSA